ncbi:MAG TPA: hypothetical protein VKV34_05165, partial [Thermoleophilia bacterium]|nr:hypothetical protein [Thermoleophilia bacterium]
TFTLTAQGGTVQSFTVELPSNPALYGTPSISPSTGGPLAAGSSVPITVSLLGNPNPQLREFVLTVQPGAIAVTVTASSPPPIP